MRDMWQGTRRSDLLLKLITIRVSSIMKMPLLNSLMSEAKLIQMTSTTTKYANKGFLSWLRGFFPHFSLRVKGRLWVGWVVSIGGFDCYFLFVVGRARNELRSIFQPLSSHLLKPTPSLYVDLVVLSSTRLKSSLIIFLLKTIFSRRAVK
jgi:hypothetical protein